MVTHDVRHRMCDDWKIAQSMTLGIVVIYAR